MNALDEALATNLKALLQEKLWLLEARLQEKRLHSPYKMLTEAEARLLAALRGESLTISDLARKQNITRQAVHKIVSGLVERNLITLEAVEGNLKNKRITFTKEGIALKKEAKNLLLDLEKEVESKIGSKDLNLLKALLKRNW